MRDVPIYDAPTRLFHWLFAGFFTVAFAIANLVDDESARFSLHMLAGLCMVFVLLLRAFGWPSWPALIVALIVAAGQTFVLSRFWAFRR